MLGTNTSNFVEFQYAGVKNSFLKKKEQWPFFEDSSNKYIENCELKIQKTLWHRNIVPRKASTFQKCPQSNWIQCYDLK